MVIRSSPTRLEGMEIEQFARPVEVGEESPTRLEGMEINGVAV